MPSKSCLFRLPICLALLFILNKEGFTQDPITITCPPGVLGFPCDFDLAQENDISGTAFQSIGGTVQINCQGVTLDQVVVSYMNMMSGDVCNGRVIRRIWQATAENCGTSNTCEQIFSFLPPVEATLDLPTFPESLSLNEAQEYIPPNINFSNGQSDECAIMGILMPQVDANLDCTAGSVSISYATTDMCNRMISYAVEIPVVCTIPTLGEWGIIILCIIMLIIGLIVARQRRLIFR